jgi:hypothetical protein
MDPELDALRQEVHRLRDHEEIRQLLYRYARGVDRADLDLIRSVYAAGGTDRHGPFDGPGEEFAEVVVDGAKQVWNWVGNHHITNMSVHLDGDRARAEVYFLAFHPHADNGHPEMGIISGRYLDVLERQGERWGIVRRVVVSTARSGSGPPSVRGTSVAGGERRTPRTTSSAELSWRAGTLAARRVSTHPLIRDLHDVIHLPRVVLPLPFRAGMRPDR